MEEAVPALSLSMRAPERRESVLMRVLHLFSAQLLMEQTMRSCPISAAALIAFGLGVTSVPASGQTATLQDFVAQYPEINSIALTASVTYLLSPIGPACGGPAGIPILGSFAYSANGEMWRCRSYLDHEAASDLRTEIAYDGSMYQYHQMVSDVLGISFGDDDRAAGFVLPNPLYAAAQFLIPVTDGNGHKIERLTSLQSAASAADLSGITWQSDPASLHTYVYADLPGGSHEGHEYFHRVFVIDGQRDKPVRIDRLSTTGATLTRTMLSGYSDLGGGIELPTSYIMILYDADTGIESGRIEMTLTYAEINTTETNSLDSYDFQIPWNLVGRVWLIDNEVFVN